MQFSELTSYLLMETCITLQIQFVKIAQNLNCILQ